jgi:predicted ribosome quality control (RQC) complex YloA/Tae2 family protein
MPLDGLTIKALADEFDLRLSGARIQKVYQPKPLLLLLKLYRREGAGFLVVSMESSKPLIWFSEKEPKSQLSQRGFCQIMRKYTEGSKITSVRQHPGWERILYIDCKPSGDLYLATKTDASPAGPRLIIELMGRNSNVILLDQYGKILGCLKEPRESDSSLATERLEPGALYTLPPQQSKLAPETVDAALLASAIKEIGLNASTPVKNALVSVVAGIGPSTAGCICAKAGVCGLTPICQVSSESLGRVSEVICDIAREVKEERITPSLIMETSKEDPGLKTPGVSLAEVPCIEDHLAPGVRVPLEPVIPFDFFAFEPEFERDSASEGMANIRLRSMSSLLYVYSYTSNALNAAGNLKQATVVQITGRLQSLARKKAAQIEDLSRFKEALSYRQFADLLMANMTSVEKGAQNVLLEDFVTGEQVLVPLDPSLSPAANAQEYYGKYRKAKRAVTAIRDQIEKTSIEMTYLEQLLVSVRTAYTFENLERIKEELLSLEGRKGTRSGFMRSRETKGSTSFKQKSKTIEKAPWENIRHFVSSDGLYIYVGGSNRQNDLLTFRVARPQDVWLHVKEAPGAHVIVRVPEGAREDWVVPEKTLIEAAQAAAFFSKSKFGQKVPVDWTVRKHVYKIKGMPPGKVMYKEQRTVYVQPKDMTD